jgi:hypothetical protein
MCMFCKGGQLLDRTDPYPSISIQIADMCSAVSSFQCRFMIVAVRKVWMSVLRQSWMMQYVAYTITYRDNCDGVEDSDSRMEWGFVSCETSRVSAVEASARMRT